MASSSSLATFTILPLSLPSTSNLPTSAQQATHYLYLRPHAPKISDVDTSRSLFVSNVPFDATESSIRSFFSNHLGGSKIERVEFEPEDVVNGATAGSISRKRRQTEESQQNGSVPAKGSKSKKRKRGAEDADLEAPEAQLPNTWDKPLLRSGSCAVLVFVDKASAGLAMKACKKAALQAKKRGQATIEWEGEGLLGLERMWILKSKSTWNY